MRLRQLSLGPALASWMLDIRPRVPCSAHRSTDGGACRNFAMRGTTVCHAHGGRAIQVRRAAFDRLAQAGHEALAAKACYQLGLWPKDAAHAYAVSAVSSAGVRP